MLSDSEVVQTIVLDLLKRHRVRYPGGLDALLRREPVAVAVHFDAKSAVDTLRRPQAVAAQVALRPMIDECLHVRVERRLALGACGHLGVAEQRVHFGAAERQRRRQGTLERHRMRVRADGGGHQHPRTALRGVAR
jgi:hypothetical protein